MSSDYVFYRETLVMVNKARQLRQLVNAMTKVGLGLKDLKFLELFLMTLVD